MKIIFIIFPLLLLHYSIFSQDNALDFGGSGDYVTLPEIGDLNNTFTFEYQIYYKGGDGSFDRVLSDNTLQFDIDTGGGGTVKFWYYNTDTSDGCTWLSTGYTLPLDTWTHLAWVNDGSGIELFVDGVSVYSNPSCNENLIDISLTLGGRLDGVQDGNIILDEFRVWNINRTQSEIANNMNSELTGNEFGLVSYYNFNQGVPEGSNPSETVLIDGTSNSNDGTLIDFALSGSTSNWVSSSALLPVELIEFTGKVKKTGVELSWVTTNEINNQGFNIQKSRNGFDWKKIKFIKGATRSEETNAYNFFDTNPYHGANYYRLKQIDFDGNYEFSKIIGVNLTEENEINVYPNPSENEIEIAGVEKGQVSISDKMGKVVLHSTYFGDKIDISKLSIGIYFIHINSGDRITTKRLIKI